MDLNEIIKNKSNEKYQAANVLYQTSRLVDHADYNLIKTRNEFELAKSEKEFIDSELIKAQEYYDKLCEELDKLTKDI